MIIRTFAILAVTALAACAPAEPPAPAPNPALDAAEGARYNMASLIGIGDIVIGPNALVISNGDQIAIEKIADGVYAFPNPPSRLSNGEDFCFSKPVTFFTWHKHDEGLWVMNVGDWRSPPTPPASDVWDVPGGCGLSTYSAG